MSKREAWLFEVDVVSTIRGEIEATEAKIAEMREDLAKAQERADAAASAYAEERVAEDKNVIDGPNGEVFLIAKARKGRGGVEPKNKFRLEEVKR